MITTVEEAVAILKSDYLKSDKDGWTVTFTINENNVFVHGIRNNDPEYLIELTLSNKAAIDCANEMLEDQ